MVKLVEDIAKVLVDHPEDVKVTQRDDKGVKVIELSVLSEDMGKVIGKQGRIANAIRSVIKIAAIKKDERVSLDIVG